MATPSGDLLEYNPYSKKTSIVTSDLPSDPKDPKRKNNINPKDIPAEKGKQRMKELLQKPDLNIPVSRENIFIGYFKKIAICIGLIFLL